MAKEKLISFEPKLEKAPAWKDINNGFMLHGAILRGKYEVPEIFGTTSIPKELIPFSEVKTVALRDRENYTVHFWEHEDAYDDIWRKPRRADHRDRSRLRRERMAQAQKKY
jgi:hypothetical protein